MWVSVIYVYILPTHSLIMCVCVCVYTYTHTNTYIILYSFGYTEYMFGSGVRKLPRIPMDVSEGNLKWSTIHYLASAARSLKVFHFPLNQLLATV